MSGGKLLRPYDFDDNGVRQCPAVERRAGELAECRTVVLCPAIFCRAHWKRLPHYLQDGIVQGMLARIPRPEKAAAVDSLVKAAIAFILGPSNA
jgi:hypothetical protein